MRKRTSQKYQPLSDKLALGTATTFDEVLLSEFSKATKTFDAAEAPLPSLRVALKFNSTAELESKWFDWLSAQPA